MDHWSGSRTSVNARRGKSEEALEVCQPRKSESSRVEEDHRLVKCHSPVFAEARFLFFPYLRGNGNELNMLIRLTD